MYIYSYEYFHSVDVSSYLCHMCVNALRLYTHIYLFTIVFIIITLSSAINRHCPSILIYTYIYIYTEKFCGIKKTSVKSKKLRHTPNEMLQKT